MMMDTAHWARDYFYFLINTTRLAIVPTHPQQRLSREYVQVCVYVCTERQGKGWAHEKYIFDILRAAERRRWSRQPEITLLMDDKL